MQSIAFFTSVVSLLGCICAHAQAPAPVAKRICMDVAHQQKFWNDPSDMAGSDARMVERVKYMTGELTKTASAVNASLSYLKMESRQKISKDATCCSSIFLRPDIRLARSAPFRNASPPAARCSW